MSAALFAGVTFFADAFFADAFFADAFFADAFFADAFFAGAVAVALPVAVFATAVFLPEDLVAAGALAGAVFLEVPVGSAFAFFGAALFVVVLAVLLAVVLAVGFVPGFFAAAALVGVFDAAFFAVVLVAGDFVPDFVAGAFFAVAFLVEDVDFVVVGFVALRAGVAFAVLAAPDLLVTLEVTRFAAAAVLPASFFAVVRAIAAGPP